jgi:hypothetical protein
MTHMSGTAAAAQCQHLKPEGTANTVDTLLRGLAAVSEPHHCLYVPVQLPVQVLLLPAEDVHQLPHHHHVALHVLQVVLVGKVLVAARRQGRRTGGDTQSKHAFEAWIQARWRAHAKGQTDVIDFNCYVHAAATATVLAKLPG